MTQLIPLSFSVADPETNSVRLERNGGGMIESKNKKSTPSSKVEIFVLVVIKI